ncbi:hypothetical protein [Streptomyces sp. NPDC059256]|uniref:hypothetical protein n=1 Tax=Streptomyces sp. NPDC059256 TaxID=3346794 RepID=UPI003674D6A2
MLDDLLAGELCVVEAAMRKAVAPEIMARYRQLATHEFVGKSGPHDLVMIADDRSEERLTAFLTAPPVPTRRPPADSGLLGMATAGSGVSSIERGLKASRPNGLFGEG